jgi:hypothetical protein
MDVIRSPRRRGSLLLLFGLVVGLAIFLGLQMALAASETGAPAIVATSASASPAAISSTTPALPPSSFVDQPAQESFASVHYRGDHVGGWYGPGVTVQFTVTASGGAIKGTGSGTTGPGGNMDGVRCDCDIIPGDQVHVTSSGGFDEVVDVVAIIAQIDPAHELVTGHIEAKDLPGIANIYVLGEYRQIESGMDGVVNADGDFTADFSGRFDLQRSDKVDVWYKDDNGNNCGAWTYLLHPLINYAHEWVEVLTEPDVEVMVSVQGKASCQGQADDDGYFITQNHCNWNAGQPDIAPGDKVTISAAGVTGIVDPVGTIEGQVDAVENTVSGTINAPGWSESLYRACEIWSSPWSTRIAGSVNPDNGAFACDFDSVGWDVKSSDMVGVTYAEPDGDAVINFFYAPYARANTAWDSVDGWFGADVSVSYAVEDGHGNPKGSGGGTAGSDGWLNGVGCNCDIAPGDHIFVSSGAGFDAELVAIDITGDVDLDADLITGQVSAGVLPAHGYMDIKSEEREMGTRVEFTTDDQGVYEVDLNGEFDIRRGDLVHVWYLAPDGNQLGSEFYTVEVQRVDIAVSQHNINGFAPQGPVTITTATEERILPGGWFNQSMDDPFLPGSSVTVQAGQGLYPVVIQIPAPFTAFASSITDTVWGRVDNLNHKIVVVQPDDVPEQKPETDSQGYYNAVFTDLPRGATGQTSHDMWVNGAHVGFHRPWQTPDLILDVNYGSDSVETLYEAGHTIWITLTNASGTTIKATDSGVTGYVPGWGEQTGYGNAKSGWTSGPTDIVPGDWVHASLDNGQATSVRIGEIAGTLSTSLDTVAGNITADWFTAPLKGRCSVWVENGPQSIDFTVDPDGGAYHCDFGAIGWDLLPGQTVGVTYAEPDGDHVLNAFQGPYARANYGTDSMDGWFGPGVTVYFTVTTSVGNVVKGTGHRATRSDGWMDGTQSGCDMIPGDRVHVTSSAGFNSWLVLTEITGWLDPDGDKVGGHMAGAPNAQANINVYSHGSGTGWGRDVTADENGDFAVDLQGQWNVQPGDQVDIYRYDANRNQVGNQVTGLRLEVDYGDDWMWGRTMPNAAVDVKIAGQATCAGQADSNGNFWIDAGKCNPSQPDIRPGDHVTANASGYTAELNPVGTILGAVNVKANTVDGTITISGYGQPLHVWCEVWTDNGPPGIELWVDPAGGSYHCDFDDVGFDLKSYHRVAVKYAEPDGDSVTNTFYQPHARANITGDNVDGWFGPGVEVAVTVSDSANIFKCSTSGTANSSGWLDAIATGCDMVVGDKVVVTTPSGFFANLALIPITAHVDELLDRVTGQATGGVFPADGSVELFTPLKESGWELPTAIGTNGAFEADFSGMADLKAGYWGTAWYVRPDGNQVGIGFESLKIEANYAHDWVNGVTEPLTTVDVIVQGQATCQVQADKDGRFTTIGATWSPSPPDIQPGGAVIVSAAGFDKAINPVGTIGGAVDLAQNTVSGAIHAPFSGKLPVACQVAAEGAKSEPIWQEVEADGGTYTCDFDDIGWDLRTSQEIWVSYYEPDGDAVDNVFTGKPERVYLPVVLR